VWPTAHITELCLQLTAGSRPVNGDEHRTLRSQSCERALLTSGDFTLLYKCVCLCSVSDGQLLAQILASHESPPNTTSAVTRHVV